MVGCVSEMGLGDGIVEGQQNPSSERGTQRGILTTLKNLVNPTVSPEGATPEWFGFLEGSDSQLTLIIIGVGIALAALCGVVVSAILI